MFKQLKRKRAEKLLKSGYSRKIRIHSVVSEPEGADRPEYVRVAFEYLDPPGPWSIQFYEADPSDVALWKSLEPGTEARFYTSEEDEGATRLLVTEDKRPLWPR